MAGPPAARDSKGRRWTWESRRPQLAAAAAHRNWGLERLRRKLGTLEQPRKQRRDLARKQQRRSDAERALERSDQAAASAELLAQQQHLERRRRPRGGTTTSTGRRRPPSRMITGRRPLPPRPRTPSLRQPWPNRNGRPSCRRPFPKSGAKNGVGVVRLRQRSRRKRNARPSNGPTSKRNDKPPF